MTAPIERLRAVLAAATPGPMLASATDGWASVLDDGCVLIARTVGTAAVPNAQAIAALGTLHPALLAVVEAVQGLDECPHCSCGQVVYVARIAGAEVGSMRAEEHDDWCPLARLDAAIAAALPEAP